MAIKTSPLASVVKAFATNAESDYGVEGDLATATVLSASSGSKLDLQEREDLANPESTPDRDENSPDKGKYKAAPFSIDHSVGLNAGPASAARFDHLLQAALGGTPYNTPSGLTVQAASTTTQVNLLTAHGLLLGDVIIINGEAVSVRKVNATSVLVDPPLSSAPADTTPITQAKQFPLASDGKTITIHALFDLMALRGEACIVENLKLDFPGSDLVKISASGNAGNVKSCMATTLATAIADALAGSITFTVTDKENIEVGFYLSIGTEKGLLVTAVNKTTGEVTATRPGSGRTTHSIGDNVEPYWPSFPGTLPHVQGKSLSFRANTGAADAVVFHAESFSLDVKTGLAHYSQESGYDGPSAIDPGKRTYTATAKTLFRHGDYSRVLAAGKSAAWSIVVMGTTPDNTHGVAVYINSARITTKLDAGANALKQDLAFAIGRAVDADGNDVTNGSIRMCRW